MRGDAAVIEIKNFQDARAMGAYLEDVVSRQETSECYINEITLKYLNPIEASMVMKDLGIPDSEMTHKCVESTGMMAQMPFNGVMANIPLCPTAYKSLSDRAKLYGKTVQIHPEVLNDGFGYYTDKAKAIVQDGCLLAAHSEGYAYLPQDELYTAFLKYLTEEYGTVEFQSGFYATELTRAIVLVPALASSFKEKGIADVIPAVVFTTNDVANSAATVQAALKMKDGTFVFLGEDLAVTHTAGHTVDTFREELKKVLTVVQNAAAKLAALKDVPVKFPEDCMMNLAREFKLPKKESDEARDDFEVMRGPEVSAYDIYIALSAVPGYARKNGADEVKVASITENLTRILYVRDWNKFDDHYMR